MAQEAQELQRREPPAEQLARRGPDLNGPAPKPLRIPLGWIRRIGLGRWMSVVVLLLFVALRSWDPAPIETLRLKTFDLYQTIRPREAAVQAVAIVDIDEESLAEHGQWPWPRTLVADLVMRIADYGSIAMAFDAVFPEADRMSPDLLADSLKRASDALRQELRTLPSNDRVFADVLRRTRVVLGQSGYQRDLARGRSRPISPVPFGTIGGDPRPFLIEFPGIVRNIAELEDASSGDAMFTLLPELDGIVRRVPAVMTVESVIIPALVLELLRVATGQDAYLIKSGPGGVSSVGLAGIEIPTDGNGRIWINYARRDPGRYISAKDVLSGAAAPESLAGKLVLIGSSATGLHDVKATPLDPAMPGVEVQAQLLETILTQSYLKRPNYAAGAEVLMTVAIGLVTIVLVPLLGALMTLILGGAIALGLAGLSGYLYVSQGALVDIAYPLISSFAVYLFLVFVNYFHEETQRQQVRGAFNQYLSPDLVEQLARNPDKLVLGGETREMTFLFCDVRGFTMISELYRDDPQGLTRLMNRFLTPLTNAIIEHQGTVDKYMGDAVMAFWNAPLDDADHATHACQAALAMIESLDELNLTREAEARDAGEAFLPIRVGIGINTGVCVVGNLGSDLRFDYSVLGDPVNLASRIEGQSKAYGLSIVLGSTTAATVEDEFALLEIDLIRVRGRSEPDHIFALLGERTRALEPAFAALVEANQTMLGRFRARDWDGALNALAICRGTETDLGMDEYFDMYEARIRGFRADPPPDDWDGVFQAQFK